MEAVITAEEERLSAIAAAAAEVLATTDYHLARTEDIAAAVRLEARGDGRSRGTRRSAVWLYATVRSKRVIVALAAYRSWTDYLARTSPPPPADPTTLDASREQLTAALGEVVRFHRAERVLMVQVGHGIGDIATSEKRQAATEAEPPNWPDGPYGRVAAAGFAAKIAAFADFLAPYLRAATRVVAEVPDGEIAASALALSDLTFRACLADLEGPVDRLTNGLVAFWQERDLVRLAGNWVRDLDGAERSLAATRRRGTDPRAESYAHAVIIRVLLEAGTLHRRSAEEGTALVESLMKVTGWGGDMAEATRADLIALCDAAARRGLALLVLGDLAAAGRSFELSREVASAGLGGNRSFIARAEHNLAEVMAESGDPVAAAELLTTVRDERERLLAQISPAAPDDRRSAWRRLSLTEAALAGARVKAGHVVRGVVLAERVVADRRANQPDVAPGMHAQAQRRLAEALLAAGHPGPARQAALAAYRDTHCSLTETGSRRQDLLVLLARIARAHGQPLKAVGLLRGSAVTTAWFAEKVSPRLAYEAHRELAGALVDTGSVTEAFAELGSLTEFPWPEAVTGPQDPLAVSVQRQLAEALLVGGDAAAADAILAALPRVAAAPVRAATLLCRVRCAVARSDDASADRHADEVVAMAEAELDPVHPIVQAVRVERALIRERSGDLAGSGAELAPVVRTDLLDHGHPALGPDHPLLHRAVSLADRIGLPHGWGLLPSPLSDE